MAAGRASTDLRWFLVALAVAVLSLLVVAQARRPQAPPIASASVVDPAALTPAPDGRIRLPAAQAFAVTTPAGSTERITGLLAVPERMRFGDFRWDETGVAPGRVWVRVDLDRQLLSVFRSGQEIGTAVILYGANDTPTPTGWLTVLAKARDHYSRTYDAPMPYMLRLTADGVALHASFVREGRATHGCIGLPYAFAARLFDAMQVGDRVLVVGTHPA